MTPEYEAPQVAGQQPAVKLYEAPQLITYGLLKTLTMNGSMMQNEANMPMMGPMI